MTIYIGADHRGFQVKETLKTYLSEKGYDVSDMGALQLDGQDDYVDFAKAVASKVIGEQDSRGILICGSGVGMCIAANKLGGIRCGVGHSPEEVKAMRHDDDINVLSLPADFIDEGQAKSLTDLFLTTEFTPEERFVRRIAKIKELETHA